MSLRVVQHHLHLAGMPCTPRGTRAKQKAVACHDTESLPGEAATWNVISWMHATAPTRNASYNEFWSVDEVKQELLVIVVVPQTHAAHSIAPQPYSTSGGVLYAPDAQVAAALGSNVNDPNMWVYAVSISGRVADVQRYAGLPWFVRDARQRLAQLALLGINTDHLLEHFRFNPRTRSDWGRLLVPALKGSSDMQFRNPIVTQEWDTVPGAASTFTRPDGSTGYFTAKERVKTVAEGTVNGVDVRLMDYGPSHEALVIPRGGLTNPGVRIVGSPEPTVTTVVKEVVKEVPTGITQAQLDEAVRAARLNGAEAEKDRLANLLGL